MDDAPARPPARGLQIAGLSGVLAAGLATAHVAVGYVATGAAQVLLHLLVSGTATAAARARGWRVVGDGTGAHLDVANDPGRVAHLLG